MGKTLKKNLLRKNQKNRAFSTPCENSARLAKIPNIISQGVRKFLTPCEIHFAGHAKNSHTQLCEKLYEIRECANPFCNLREISQTLCEFQQPVQKPTVT